VALTALFQICFNILIVDSYGPLESALPLSLADKTYDPSQPTRAEVDEEDLATESAPNSASDSRARQDVAKMEHGGATPAPVEAKPRDEEAEEDEEHDYYTEGPKDFDHPASVDVQRIIWVPNDDLGLGKAEVEDMRRRGIEGSVEQAQMNEKGKIKITGPPPGGPDVNVE
jgi:hypothetical protein